MNQISTYYLGLIKKGQEDITSIQCRINQLCSCLDFAEEAVNAGRIKEIKAEITELAKKKMEIQEKIERHAQRHNSMLS